MCIMFNPDDYDDYFLWLCSLVDADMDRYSELLFTLYGIPFIWVLEQDQSRETEGLLMREEFYENDTSQDWIWFWEQPCSVLEALIPIARRMNDILTDDDTGDRTRVFFWRFIENLGLKKYTNGEMSLFFEPRLYSYNDIYETTVYDTIKDLINSWLQRCFDWNGVGSIFPLEQADSDQRQTTIVYQMYNYIRENFPDG